MQDFTQIQEFLLLIEQMQGHLIGQGYDEDSINQFADMLRHSLNRKKTKMASGTDSVRTKSSNFIKDQLDKLRIRGKDKK